MNANKIREVTVEKDSRDGYKRVRIVFGPHYFVDIFGEKGKLTLALGATHHGFKAQANEVSGELETFIEEIKAKHPSNAF